MYSISMLKNIQEVTMTEAQNIREICKILLEDLQEGRLNDFKLAKALGNISGLAKSYIDQEEREELEESWHRDFWMDKKQLAQDAN